MEDSITVEIPMVETRKLEELETSSGEMYWSSSSSFPHRPGLGTSSQEQRKEGQQGSAG
jgi:hypothetical protein